MKLRTIDVALLLVLGLLSVARATWGVFKDINVNLSEAKTVTGKVIYADINQIEEATFKSKKYKSVFLLKLNNSNQNFAIDRGAEFCRYLKAAIGIGDTVKLLYRLSTSEHNTFVFQIEKNKKIIADFNGYKKKQTRMIVLLYLFGFIILGGLGFWHFRRKRSY